MGAVGGYTGIAVSADPRPPAPELYCPVGLATRSSRSTVVATVTVMLPVVVVAHAIRTPRHPPR